MYGAKPHQHQSLYHTGGGGKKRPKREEGEDRYSNTPLSAPVAPDVIPNHRCRQQEDKWLP